MTEGPASSTWRLYARLIAYARPYKGRLVVGILAGFLAGGSLFGLLQASPRVIRPFEEPILAADAVDVADSADAADPVDAAPPSSAADEEVMPPDKRVEKLVKIAARYGIPILEDDGRMTWQFMLLGMIGLPVFVLLRAFANYVNRYYMRWIGARLVRDVRNDLFTNLQSQSLKFFGRTDVGKLISRCTNDATVVEHVIATTISDVTRAPIEIAVSVGFIITFAVQNELVGLVALMSLAMPFCSLPIVILGRRVRRYTRRALMGVSDLVTRMHENFTGITAVKAFHMEAREADRFHKMNAGYFRSIMKALRAELLMSPLVEAVAVNMVAVFFVICYTRGISLYQIIPLGIAAVVAYRPIKQVARINAGLQRGGAALERIYQVLDTKDIVAEAPNPVRVDLFGDRITFENVRFSYQGPEGPDVLSDINIEIPVGSVIALVGETGSGKTTLANLLARFYDPTGGCVRLDGTDLRDMEIASLRRLIGVVTQQTILFNDSIAANIAYGTPEATPAAVEAAARRANAHRFIASDPAGYDRIVGEKGFVLSGGERQRIAIARAILKNPPILILDEATSALDTVTERLVQEAISRLMEGRTVFAIAHRLSTVKHADQILLVDGGRIVERGTHDELYHEKGHYRMLCDMQVMDV